MLNDSSTLKADKKLDTFLVICNKWAFGKQSLLPKVGGNNKG